MEDNTGIPNSHTERKRDIRRQAITVFELTKGITPEQRANASNEFRTMEEFAGYILELTNETRAPQPETGWISVKDRLPDTSAWTMVYVAKHWADIIFYSTDTKEWWDEGKKYETEVTHWMPLPKPPTE